MADIEDFLTKETAGLPNWAWLAVVGVGVGAAYILPKFFGKGSTQQTSTDSGTPNSGIGLAVDPTTGLPYAVEGLVPTGAGAGTSGTTTPPGTPGSGGTGGLIEELVTIRQRYSKPEAQGYDKGNTGIPIHSGPSNSMNNILSKANFGSTLVITGPAISGESVYGNNQWYPVLSSTGQAGYISGFDIQGPPTYINWQDTGTQTQRWPIAQPVNAGRYQPL